MKTPIKPQYLILVIACSLALLAIVEGLWIHKLYSNEKLELKAQINQTLSTQFAGLQMTYMQRNNVRLIDSFLSSKQKEEEKKRAYQIPLNSYFTNVQNTYFKTLDSISSFRFGSNEDNARIDSFLNVMRDYYRKNVPSPYKIGKTEKDTFDWLTLFEKKHGACYSSLWHLYTLKFSPHLDRNRMDTYFNQVKSRVRDESFNFFKNVLFNKANRNIRVNSYPKHFSSDMKVFISGDSNSKKQPSKQDSFLSFYAYEFQRFVGTLIDPFEVKRQLEMTYKDLEFEVTRIPVSEMIPHQRSNALLLSIPAGDKMDIGWKKEKIGVAVYGYSSLILNKIWAEIAFAIFVFLMVALAFGLIYRAMKQQQKLMELKNDFINNMTHELKTPITTVGVAIEAMDSFKAMENPDRAKEYLEISQNELGRLSLLVDKVLKMASFEDNDAILNLSTVNLAELTEQVIKSMRLQFDKYGAEIDFKIEADNTPYNIEADKTHISSVIYNLIDNALKYGGEKPHIRLQLEHIEEENNVICLSIADSGQGIPPQYLDKIFDKFFRIPTGDVHNIKGHGLGLSYVAHVVKQHKGRIGVKSKEGEGTQFSIIFPTVV